MQRADNMITLYNALYDSAAGYDRYKRAALSGVTWFSRVKTTVSGDGGLLAANEFTVRIPGELCSGYVEPRAYTGAVDTWTLQTGDIIIKGEALEENPRPADLKKAYRDIMTVIGVTDSRLGRGGHLKVVGK